MKTVYCDKIWRSQSITDNLIFRSINIFLLFKVKMGYQNTTSFLIWTVTYNAVM